MAFKSKANMKLDGAQKIMLIKTRRKAKMSLTANIFYIILEFVANA